MSVVRKKGSRKKASWGCRVPLTKKADPSPCLQVTDCLLPPDPTAGPSASDQSTWYLDESTLTDNIKKTLHKFCGPSPVVFR